MDQASSEAATRLPFALYHGRETQKSRSRRRNLHERRQESATSFSLVLNGGLLCLLKVRSENLQDSCSRLFCDVQFVDCNLKGA